jgi:hypothetical protein
MSDEVFGRLNTFTTPEEPCPSLEIDGHIISIRTITPSLPKSTNIRLDNIETRGNFITAIANLWERGKCKVVLEVLKNCASGTF